MEPALFYLFAGLAIFSALGVITFPNPTRALLSLILTMFSLAGLFLLLGAYFVAMIHLIVYAGAVLVLFLFVIMLQGIGAKDIPLRSRFSGIYLFSTGITGLLFLGVLLILATKADMPSARGIQGTIEAVGVNLFQNYLLPFELVSVLLLLGVFAAVALAKKEKET